MSTFPPPPARHRFFRLIGLPLLLFCFGFAPSPALALEEEVERLFRAGDYPQVIAKVDEAPAGGVTSPTLSLFKGLAAEKLGLRNESFVALTVARALGSQDPRLVSALNRLEAQSEPIAPTVRFSSLEEAQRATAPSSPSRDFKTAEEVVFTEEPSKPWTLDITFAAGWNSNVLGLGKSGVPAPLASSRADGGFIALGADFAAQWRIAPEFFLTTGWFFQQTLYDRHGAANLTYNYGFIEGLYRWNNFLSGFLRLSNEYTAYGGFGFRNRLGVNPGVFLSWSPQNVTEIAYDYSYSSYFFQTSFPFFERSGNAHTIRVRQILFAPNRQSFLSMGYHHKWNLADGSDFVFQENGLGFYFGSPLWWEFELTGFYSWAIAQYRYNNSQAGTSGFAYRRRDLIQTVGVELSRPLFGNVRGFANYTFTNNYSNIGFYFYDQHIVSAGVGLSF